MAAARVRVKRCQWHGSPHLVSCTERARAVLAVVSDSLTDSQPTPTLCRVMFEPLIEQKAWARWPDVITGRAACSVASARILARKKKRCLRSIRVWAQTSHPIQNVPPMGEFGGSWKTMWKSHWTSMGARCLLPIFNAIFDSLRKHCFFLHQ